MNLVDLTAIANSYTDENFSTTLTKLFADEAIATINTELKANLPAFPASASTAYTALSDDWLRAVVAPYIAYSIKMNDGSLNEADRLYIKFQRAFQTLKKEKSTAIPVAYQSASFIGSKIWVDATVTDWDNCPTKYQIDLGNAGVDLIVHARLNYNAERVNPLSVIHVYDTVKLQDCYAKIGIGKSFRITAHRW